jgi:outer membrane protein with beta-barrel domain
MRQVINRLIIAAAVAMICVPTYARAEGYVNPWTGVQFGSQIQDGRGGFGVSAGGMGNNGVAGGELVFGMSPSFFGTRTDFGDNTVIDVMGNVVIAVPINSTRGRAGARPYVTAGLGMIHTQIDGGNVFNVANTSNQLAYNVGGGAMGYFNRHVGIRGDLRYLRTLQGDVINGLDLGNFHFWRVSAGVVIR